MPSVWLERQIAIIGMHAWSRMAENSSSLMLSTMPAPGFFLPACRMPNVPSRPATAFRRLSQQDDLLPCSQKRRLRAERPEHCRFISSAYPVGRRGAFGCLRHISRIVCWAAGRSGTRILVLTGPDRVLLLVPARAVSCPAQQQQQPRSPVRAQLHVMQYSGFAIHTLPVMS